jgi:hypothetical protein
MRHLSAIFLIGLLIVLPSCKYFRGRGILGKKSRAEAIMKARVDSIRHADSIQIVLERKAAIENAKLDTVKTADEERLSLKGRNKYFIIVGSYNTPENAKRLSEEFRKRGYDPQIIKPEGSKRNLVSAEGFDSFEKAALRLKQFQDTVLSKAWLYIEK